MSSTSETTAPKTADKSCREITCVCNVRIPALVSCASSFFFCTALLRASTAMERKRNGMTFAHRILWGSAIRQQDYTFFFFFSRCVECTPGHSAVGLCWLGSGSLRLFLAWRLRFRSVAIADCSATDSAEIEITYHAVEPPST